MQIAEAVRLARLLAGLSLDEVAAFAGISPDDLAGLERGAQLPTFDVFDDIMLVAGYQMSAGALVPRCDRDAIRAARRLLDSELGIAATTGSQRIAAGWRRRGITDPDDIARRAGYAARVSVRPGARQFVWPTGSVLDVSRFPVSLEWAIADNPDVVSSGLVLHVDDVDLAVASLGPMSEARTVAPLTILPFDEVTAAGMWVDEAGGRWTSPSQAVIDHPGRPIPSAARSRPTVVGRLT